MIKTGKTAIHPRLQSALGFNVCDKYRILKATTRIKNSSLSLREVPEVAEGCYLAKYPSHEVETRKTENWDSPFF